MRLALTHPFSWPDVQRGGERLFDDLARWLAGAGHDVLTVSTSSRPWRRSDGRRTDVRHRAPARGTAVAYLPAAAWDLRRWRPDVVHGLYHLDGVAGRASGRPHLVHVQGMPSRAVLERRRVHARLLGPSVAKAARVVAVSRAAATALEAELGIPAVALHNGVWTDAFAAGGGMARADRPTVLFPGDPADPRKRLGVLVDALTRLPDVRLAVAAPCDPGPLRARLGDRVDALDVGDPAAMPAAYGRAWVTCLPAVREAFGLVLVESLAAGRPAVAVDDGGVPEVVQERSWLAPPDDPAALAVALERALDDAAHVATAERCRTMAAPFDWSVRGPAFEALYAEVAGS